MLQRILEWLQDLPPADREGLVLLLGMLSPKGWFGQCDAWEVFAREVRAIDEDMVGVPGLVILLVGFIDLRVKRMSSATYWESQERIIEDLAERKGDPESAERAERLTETFELHRKHWGRAAEKWRALRADALSDAAIDDLLVLLPPPPA